MFLEGGTRMYNGKFERGKTDKKQLFMRYIPLVFIVLISAVIVLLGYWLYLGAINAVNAVYEFWVENSDKLAFTNEVFVVLTVIFLVVAFAILLRKSYLSEWANYPIDSEEDSTKKSAETIRNTQKTNEPKMVRKVENTVSKQPSSKRKRTVKNNMVDYEVSSNEVVWTNEEPSNRYGYKF